MAPPATAGSNAACLAACPHVLTCGGCYDFGPKDDLLPAALHQAGYANLPPIALAISPPSARRRMDLAARRTANGAALGLHRHRSHDIVDLETCRVLHPDLVALFGPLRALLPRLDLLRRTAALIANRLDTGIDLLIRSDAPASRHDRARLADFASAHRIARISHAVENGAPEPLASLRPAIIKLSGFAVAPPPGAFLQATEEGEQAIIAAVLAALPSKRTARTRIAELYAGCGTLSFALAPHARIDTFEGDADAQAALAAGLRAANLVGRVTARQRDLIRQPLAAAELAAYAAIVLDPPSAGAPVQIPLIAQAATPIVIYVSCNPETLARDAATLNRAGYSLAAATAIDQFIGTPRIESVTVFHKRKPARRPQP